MKILHTSDWHLGIYLENFSRLEEQRKFIDELSELAEQKNVDAIVVAGDIFDTQNPSAAAENLFYEAMAKLSNKKRLVVVISGNHDSPDRLEASRNLAVENGIVVVGNISNYPKTGDYDFFVISDSGRGFFSAEINGNKFVFLTIPYLNEKRLQAILTEELNAEELQRNFSERIGEILGQLSGNFQCDAFNIIAGHCHITGGEPSGGERDITLGGAFAVSSAALPDNADYVALGHLHKNQRVPKARCGFYSGSPIQYGLSEANRPKYVVYAEKSDGQVMLENIPLKCHRPIVEKIASSIDEAIEFCDADSASDSYLYLKIVSDKPLLSADIKQMKSLRKNIVSIEFSGNREDFEIKTEDVFKSDIDEFIDFYTFKKSVEPTDELKQLFLEILYDESREEIE